MSETDGYELLFEAQGAMEANLIVSYLVAQGIEVVKIGAGAGEAFGFTMGPLGRVELYVPAAQIEAAETLLDEMFEDMEAAEDDDDEEEEWDDDLDDEEAIEDGL